MSKDAWRIPDNERPPARFWQDFGLLVMASMRGDNSDEYRETLWSWANILQRRYHGHKITGQIILDYLDVQLARIEAAPDVTERKGRKVC